MTEQNKSDSVLRPEDESAERREWTAPKVTRIEAGAAETGFDPANVDGTFTSS